MSYEIIEVTLGLFASGTVLGIGGLVLLSVSVINKARKNTGIVIAVLGTTMVIISATIIPIFQAVNGG